MKKIILFMLLSAIFFTNSEKCHAQFLKKLAKGIENVSKKLDETLGTTAPAEPSKITVSSPHRNLQVNVIGAEMSGDNYILEFTITNKGENIKEYCMDRSTDVYDNLGTQCRAEIIMGNSQSSFGSAAGGSLLNDTPAKIRVVLSGFSSNATSFSQIRIKGETYDHGYTNRPDGDFVFKNLPIIKEQEQEVVIPVKEVEKPRVTETSQAVDNTPAIETQPTPIVADYTLSKDQMNGWKAEGLLGKIQSVKYSTGRQVFFNTVGNPAKIINGKDVVTRTYTTLNPVKNSANLKLTYGKNIREIQDYYEIQDGCGYGESYTFNSQGKVIIHWVKQGCSDVYEEKYIYTGTAGSFPSMIKGENSWESGSWEVTRTYQYMEFDNNGNWTKRKVTEVTVSTDYETEKKTSETKNYIETAMYVYY
jgi:hypothetical protein